LPFFIFLHRHVFFALLNMTCPLVGFHIEEKDASCGACLPHSEDAGFFGHPAFVQASKLSIMLDELHANLAQQERISAASQDEKASHEDSLGALQGVHAMMRRERSPPTQEVAETEASSVTTETESKTSSPTAHVAAAIKIVRLRDTIKTLHTLVNNIVQNRNDSGVCKFLTLKKANKKLGELIFSVEQAVELLRAIGFEDESDPAVLKLCAEGLDGNGGNVVVLNKLRQAKTALATMLGAGPDDLPAAVSGDKWDACRRYSGSEKGWPLTPGRMFLTSDDHKRLLEKTDKKVSLIDGRFSSVGDYSREYLQDFMTCPYGHSMALSKGSVYMSLVDPSPNCCYECLKVGRIVEFSLESYAKDDFLRQIKAAVSAKNVVAAPRVGVFEQILDGLMSDWQSRYNETMASIPPHEILKCRLLGIDFNLRTWISWVLENGFADFDGYKVECDGAGPYGKLLLDVILEHEKRRERVAGSNARICKRCSCINYFVDIPFAFDLCHECGASCDVSCETWAVEPAAKKAKQENQLVQITSSVSLGAPEDSHTDLPKAERFQSSESLHSLQSFDNDDLQAAILMSLARDDSASDQDQNGDSTAGSNVAALPLPPMRRCTSEAVTSFEIEKVKAKRESQENMFSNLGYRRVFVPST
jgi:hypothetical protein